MPAGPLRRLIFAALMSAAAVQVGGVAAQDLQTAGVLTLNQERFFNQSAFGLRVLRELEAKSAALATENRGIEEALTGEEQDLTDKRPSLTPTEFRALADAFDAKVEGIRQAQAQKAVDLNAWLEAEQKRFFEAAFPVLLALASDLGASVILDQRATLIALDRSDITNQAILKIDQAIGDGKPQP